MLHINNPDGRIINLGEITVAFVRRLLPQGMIAHAVAQRTSVLLDIVGRLLKMYLIS